MKLTLRFMVLPLVLVWAQAKEKNDCKELKKTIHPEQVKQLEGSWVLVWEVSNDPRGQSLVQNVTNQHLTIHMIDDKTMSYVKNHFYRNQTSDCALLTVNATFALASDETNFILQSGIVVEDGEERPMRTVTLSFYQTGHWLHMFYRSKIYKDYFMVYRREGHHTDSVEQGMEELYKKRAVCLGFPTEPCYMYCELSELCGPSSPTKS